MAEFSLKNVESTKMFDGLKDSNAKFSVFYEDDDVAYGLYETYEGALYKAAQAIRAEDELYYEQFEDSEVLRMDDSIRIIEIELGGF